ncbi:HutD family protein [Haloimpatiens sp. FM7330]|uniref:HutD family protein n=1 Tax=Haloimpatiens sp. FM7330 TaxID=3298610 RepID=UPI0036269F1A
MSYNIELIKKEQQKTSNWTGGTTTELAIYPKDSSYNERNFKWRLSSAKVEAEESTFTELKGIWRLIMVLDGKITLKHEAYYNKHLAPFQQDSFSGEWITKSCGKVRDFNLMMAEGSEGQIGYTHLYYNDVYKICCNDNKFKMKKFKYLTEAFYCIKGKVSVIINGKENIDLCKDEILLVNMYNEFDELIINVNNKCEEDSIVIRASIIC